MSWPTAANSSDLTTAALVLCFRNYYQWQQHGVYGLCTVQDFIFCDNNIVYHFSLCRCSLFYIMSLQEKYLHVCTLIKKLSHYVPPPHPLPSFLAKVYAYSKLFFLIGAVI